MGLAKKALKFFRSLFKMPVKLPAEAQIEITNRCNLNCPMCPRDNFKDLPREDMPFAVFARLLEKLPKIRRFILTGWGEPLVHPDFILMLEKIKQQIPAAKIRFTTNGLLLKGELLDKILEKGGGGVEQINISLESLPGEGKVEERLGHSASEKVVSNLKELLTQRGKKPFPRINLQVTLQKEGWDKIKALLNFAGENGIDSLTLVRLEKTFDPNLPRPSWPEEGRLWLKAKKLAKKLKLPVFLVNRLPFLNLISRPGRYCLRLDDYLYINIKGEAAPCCNLRDYSPGSLLSGELLKLYQASEFKQLRKGLAHPVCKACDAFFYRYSREG